MVSAPSERQSDSVERNKSVINSESSSVFRKVAARLSVPLSEIVLNTKSQLTSLNSIPWSNFEHDDEDLRIGVYVKTLQALIYPISKSDPHKFEQFTATKPTYCCECEGFLWGLARQGLKCRRCKVKCHEKCQALFNSDCLQRAAERSAKGGRTSSLLTSQLDEKMKKREGENLELFELVRRTFDIDGQEHADFMRSIRQAVLDGLSQWSAKIQVTVVGAQGLMAKDNHSGASDPYVTVQVGKVKKKTRTMSRDLNPEWNETFTFDCQNSSDRIKVRIWDEDDDIRGKVKHTFIREADDFLGQTMIDVRSLSGEMDLWYTLEKRTEEDDVSGAIRLKLTVEIKGEEKSWPFHVQYSYLHESLFNYLCTENEGIFILPHVKGDEAWKTCFDYPAEEVIKEFTVRYGIEQIFVAMTHFSCLGNKYLSDGVPGVLSTLLVHINGYYSYKAAAANVSACYMFNAANFGKDNFTNVLDRLYNMIRLDLSMYRCMFPSDKPQKLRDLKSTIDLLTSIAFFRLKVQELQDAPRSVWIIKECIMTCLKETYRMLFDNSSLVYSKLGLNIETSEESNQTSNKLQSWHKLTELIQFTIEEDRSVYEPVFSHFLHDTDFGSMSASQFWQLFSSDLKTALESHEARNQIQDSTEFVNLHLKLDIFFRWLTTEFPSLKDEPCHFVRWLEPLMLRWLRDKEDSLREYIKSAYQRDEQETFQPLSQYSLFSSSVVDTFACLTQTLDIIKRLNCPFAEIKANYQFTFAKMIVLLLTYYSELILSNIYDFAHNPETVHVACTLMNNLQQERHQLEELYLKMGSEELDAKSASLLKEMQKSLIAKLDKASDLFADGYSPWARSRVQEVGTILTKIKGPATVTNQAAVHKQRDVMDDALSILAPVEELLQGQMSAYKTHCDLSVRKRLLKKLWQTVLRLFEDICLLPTQQTALEFGLRDTRAFNVKNETTSLKNVLTSRHCAVLDVAIDNLRTTFKEDEVLQDHFLDSCPESKSLKFAISLYTQSTDSLIKNFVIAQTRQDALTRDESFGWINFQVDLYSHPWTGERKVTVRVVSCDDIVWPVIGTKLFVETFLIGPHLSGKKRRYTTKSKNNTQSPTYNESHTIVLGTEEDLSVYELQVCVKEYYFAKEDKIVGMTLLQLSSLSEETSIACRFPLARQMNIDDMGWTILRVLAQRPADELAREFVRLKTSARNEPV
ncbi:Protein unc-13 -like protein B [Halotydeus destructor]|nr:Protein unc-13 -like protein B [Halotydeus destructor]